MKTIIERIQQQMKSASSSHKLPVAYKEDLDADFDALPKYLGLGLECVWLLRSYGTVLVPIGLGVDPTFITYWLWDEHGQKVKAYHVSNEGVRPIRHEEAESLIMRAPAQLSVLDCMESIRNTVDSVLQRGTDMRIWGVFDAVTLEQFKGLNKWHSYFVQSKNCVMAEFTAKAMRLIKSKRGVQHAHAA